MKGNKNNLTKRILQIVILVLLTAVLALTIYMAVAVTRLQRRREQMAQRTSAAATTAAAMSETETAEVAESTTMSTETEESSSTEKEGFSFMDLFNPGLFDDPEAPGDGEEGSSDYAALAAEVASEKRIWMGDSRFVGMQRHVKVGPNDLFISKGAMAFDWFRDFGVPQLMEELAKDPKRMVIINFGLNDCANNCAGWTEYFAEDYVDLINQLIVTYPDTEFYFASVGLTDGDYSASNGRKLPAGQIALFVDTFNPTMYQNCLADYIDLSEYLVRDGFTTVDGVHFDQATNQKIYNYCCAKAGRYGH